PYGELPPPSYGYGYPPPHAASEPNVAAIVALVLNLFSLVSCCNVLGLAGAILAGKALRSGVDPQRARTLTNTSFVVLAAGFALMVALFVFAGVSGAFDD